MPLSYTNSADLMNDLTFRGRVKVASLKYAQSIQNEPSNTVAHNARLRWSQSCIQNPDSMAGTVTPPAVMDPAVQIAGSAIADDQLQAAVEGVVNGLF